jgi:hypothetical protein
LTAASLPVRFRLGAEELIELGRPGARAPVLRRPFITGRVRRPFLGILDILGSVAGFLANGLAFALNTLGDIVNVPLRILSQGVDIAFNAIAGILGSIPVVGELLAQIVLLGGALVKFGLSIPGLLLHGLRNVLGGVAKALDSRYSSSESQEKVDGAMQRTVDQAPSGIRDNVRAILDTSGVTGSNLALG